MEQNIRLDVNHMMADMLGSEYGVTQAQLAAMQDAAVKAQHAVEANRGTGWLGWMNLPYNQEEIVSEIEKVAERVRKTFKYFVVLGIGGSALGLFGEGRIVAGQLARRRRIIESAPARNSTSRTTSIRSAWPR